MRLLLPVSRESMRSPPRAPESGSTGEFADLDGAGVALQAKATQALPGILVGQVEAPLQVLGGCLLHVQLLGILLVKEANFLSKRRGRWSVGVLLPARLPHISPKAAYQAVVLSHFPVGLQGKCKHREAEGL